MSSKDLIITLPNPNLRKRSQKVAVIDKKTQQVIKNMKEATLDWEADRPHESGIALAAIQLNQPYRIIVMRNNPDNREDKSFHVFINPEVVKLEGEIVEDFEGCLSVKDIYGKVPRHAKARVRATNEQGQPVRFKAEGFLARIFQHEIDHTKGIMFIDHIKNKDSFFKLDHSGELIKLDYEKIRQTGIFRD